MEQNTNTGVPVTPVVNNKQKSGNGLKIATAIACIVAICGIGFGVYGMIQSAQKDNQISDLKNQNNDSGEGLIIDDRPVIEYDDYEKFANNLVRNYETHIFNYEGTNSVSISVENSHLTISDFNADEKGGESVFAEADNIIGAYLVEIGNGSVPYIYLIKKDGTVARIDISEGGARMIEDLDGF